MKSIYALIREKVKGLGIAMVNFPDMLEEQTGFKISSTRLKNIMASDCRSTFNKKELSAICGFLKIKYKAHRKAVKDNPNKVNHPVTKIKLPKGCGLYYDAKTKEHKLKAGHTDGLSNSSWLDPQYNKIKSRGDG